MFFCYYFFGLVIRAFFVFVHFVFLHVRGYFLVFINIGLIVPVLAHVGLAALVLVFVLCLALIFTGLFKRNTLFSEYAFSKLNFTFA